MRVSLSVLALALVVSADLPGSRAAPQIAADGGGAPTAGASSGGDTASDTPPATLRAPLRALSARLPSVAQRDWQITVDNPQRKQRLAWLAKDFAASSFKRADQVDEALLQSSGPSAPPHVGLIVVHFAKCRDLRDARKRVDRTGRHNFLLPVLTLFGVRSQGHNLTFVVSETPLRPEIDSLFKNVDEVLGKDSECAD